MPTAPCRSGAGTPIVGDFDGDGRADPGTYNALTGTFGIRRSLAGPLTRQLPVGPFTAPVLGDFDGDGRTDVTVFNGFTGTWSIVLSSSGATSTVTLGQPYAGRGLSMATAVPADYDGDGRTDPAVWYDSGGMWHALQSTAGFASQQWGTSGDRPVPRR